MLISNQSKRVALGLSGGVDSAVSALLLNQAGYDVTAVFLECYNTPGCRTDSDRKDALEVALSLKIPFQVLDFKLAYQEKVIAYFLAEYQAGRTPNPDVVCNREIKFGLFYDWAMSAGFDYVATGHYARVESVLSSKFAVRSNSQNQEVTAPRTPHPKLLRGIDETKDQSYFLCQLKAEQLAHILFPIGHLTKSEVRELARMHSLPVAKKADSQGICFIGEISVKAFLKSLGLQEMPGEVLFEDAAGTTHTIGAHDGAWFYTVGQRMGLQIPDSRFQISERQKRDYKQNLVKAGLDPSDLPPLFVIEKDVKRNWLVVSTREMAHKTEFEISEMHFIDEGDSIASLQNDDTLHVRIRHLGELVNVRVMAHDSYFMLHASQPLFGIAPGQIAVFYQDDVLVGWATIA